MWFSAVLASSFHCYVLCLKGQFHILKIKSVHCLTLGDYIYLFHYIHTQWTTLISSSYSGFTLRSNTKCWYHGCYTLPAASGLPTCCARTAKMTYSVLLHRSHTTHTLLQFFLYDYSLWEAPISKNQLLPNKAN